MSVRVVVVEQTVGTLLQLAENGIKICKLKLKSLTYVNPLR